jgi:hypothetical protein
MIATADLIPDSDHSALKSAQDRNLLRTLWLNSIPLNSIVGAGMNLNLKLYLLQLNSLIVLN